MTDASPQSWLRQRNPTVKLCVLFTVSFGTLFLIDPLPLFALYGLAMAAVRAGARMPWRTLAAAQVPFWLFGIGLVAVNIVSRPDGLMIGLALALRGVVIGVLTTGFLTSTPPRDLMVSLVQHARLPPRFAYAILAGHRMLNAIPGRWSTIRAAHAVRAPLRRDGRPRFGPRAFARAAFTLLAASIRSSERIALALESRGLGNRTRTIWRPLPVDRHDATMAAVVLTTMVLIVAAGAILG